MVQCKSLINSRKSELNAVLNNNINIPGGGYQNRCKDIGNLDDNTKIYVFLKKLDNWRIFKDILEDINRIFYCINNQSFAFDCNSISSLDKITLKVINIYSIVLTILHGRIFYTL